VSLAESQGMCNEFSVLQINRIEWPFYRFKIQFNDSAECAGDCYAWMGDVLVTVGAETAGAGAAGAPL